MAVTGQAQAIRHGIARALLEADPEYRGSLKRAGLLTRDPRMKNVKPGLKSTSFTTILKTLILANNIYTSVYWEVFYNLRLRQLDVPVFIISRI